MLSLTPWLLAAGAAAGQAPSERAALDVITVEASKRPVASTELAARVTVIDETRIAEELAQTIDDLVRYEPGVDVVDQGSRFGFSGFSIRGVGGNRVQIEVDGVATPDAFAIGSFSNASRDFVDIANIKQIEIVRGPASALFGSDALGGVVSFVTRGPFDYVGDTPAHIDVSAGYNGVDASTVTGLTAAAGNGDIAALLRLTQRQGEERDTPGADPLDAASLNVLGKLAFADMAGATLELSLEYFDTDSTTEVDSLEGRQDFTASFGFPYVIDTDTVQGDDRRRRSRLSLSQVWSDGVGPVDFLRWRLYRQDSETSQDTFESRRSLIAGQSERTQRRRSFQYEEALTGFELNAASSLVTGAIRHELAYGVEFETEDTEQLRDGIETNPDDGTVSRQVGPDLFPVRDFPVSTTRRFGAYLQDSIALGPLSLIPGLRWDRFDISPEPDSVFTDDNPGIVTRGLDASELSPKLGAILDIGTRWQLYGQYAEGFRAPPVNDVNVGFTNLQFGYTTIPNPDLEPETSAGYEFGVRFTGERSSFDISYFSTKYDDFIESFQVVDFDPVAQLLIFQSVNLDEVDIDGAELRAVVAPAPLPAGLTLNLAAAYAEGKDRRSGRPLGSIAPLNAVAGIDYDAPNGRWGVSTLARGAARQTDLDTGDSTPLSPAGYVVYDATAYFNANDRLRLRAGLYNLSDHRYTAYLDVQGIPADTLNPQRFERPGRQFSVAFDWTF
ncbi:MAG: TonB-dependent hemoglobin/transferrin/lactoferrin family receptor [Pseudomonadota bacterium]